jgi:23S rRNA (adenine2503-C2)-methyltransferase
MALKRHAPASPVDESQATGAMRTGLATRGARVFDDVPIPLNPTSGSIWTASDPDVQGEFVRRLEAKGIPTTLRDTRGKEIDGACGQLAAADEVP